MNVSGREKDLPISRRERNVSFSRSVCFEGEEKTFFWEENDAFNLFRHQEKTDRDRILRSRENCNRTKEIMIESSD